MNSTMRQKCHRCKMNLTLDKFKKKRDDTYQKNCNECLMKKKSNREKNKCEHGRRKNECKDCKGASICEHDRIRIQCKDCNGSQICQHNKQRSRCKECQKPTCVIIKNIISLLKSLDKELNNH